MSLRNIIAFENQKYLNDLFKLSNILPPYECTTFFEFEWKGITGFYSFPYSRNEIL